jgi:hypothetical protein
MSRRPSYNVLDRHARAVESRAFGCAYVKKIAEEVE